MTETTTSPVILIVEEPDDGIEAMLNGVDCTDYLRRFIDNPAF